MANERDELLRELRASKEWVAAESELPVSKQKRDVFVKHGTKYVVVLDDEVLVLGDVVGRVGSLMLEEALKRLQKKQSL